MKKMAFLIGLLTILTNFNIFAEDSGCITGNIKGLKLDPNCECLKTNSCQSFKKFQVSNDFYEQTDEKGKKVFDQEMKKNLNQSHEVFSKIMNLKANGKANSKQIKALYVELDKLNAQTRINILKNNSKYFDKSIKSYEQLLKENKSKKAERRKRFAKELNINLVPASSEKTIAKEVTPVSPTAPAPEVKKVERKAINQAVIASFKEEDKLKNENADNQVILDELKNANLDVKEDDSLFNIITKRYMKSAYPQLLKKKNNIEEAN